MVRRPVGDMTSRSEAAVDGGIARHEGSSYGNLPVALVISTVVGAWLGECVTATRLVVTTAVVVALLATSSRLVGDRRLRRIAVLLVVACSVCAFARSCVEWGAISRDLPREVYGAATIVSDPDPVGRAVRVVVEVDGVRYESWTYGRLARIVSRLEPGRTVMVDGEVQSTDAVRGRRLALRHVLGRLRIEGIDVETLGAGERGIDLAANRLRASMRSGASLLATPLDELFAGLVYGDDRAQPDDMVARFRESGLAHLTAVSGQNVVYVLTVFGVVLGGLRRWWRLVATIAVLGWFVVLTRAEPSVLRAATMASVTAVGFAVGGRHRTVDVLAVSMVLLVIIDPFLVWSVGWWLSIGGTVGLVVLSPVLTQWFTRRQGAPPGRVVGAVITTLAAQCGVSPVTIAVFGWPNALSIVVNLLAVPVAGIVMLVGIPVSIIAGLVPRAVGTLAMRPVGVMVWWVDRVAALGARLHPPTAVDVMATVATWFCVAAVVRSAVIDARPATRVPTLGHGRLPLPRSR